MRAEDAGFVAEGGGDDAEVFVEDIAELLAEV